MSDDDIDAQVDRLLHDAEHAMAGSEMARMVGDGQSAEALKLKARRLRDQAARLDPLRQAPAWEEW